MRLTRALMLAASCVAAAAFGINASDGAFAQGAETQSKTCRVTRAKEVEIQRIANERGATLIHVDALHRTGVSRSRLRKEIISVASSRLTV